MKATKNTVLRYSSYTTALTRSLKGTERLHCRIDEENKAVFVCNGYFLVKLTPAEYDALVRPITQCDAGDYILNADGSTAPDPLDMGKLLTDTAREAAHDLTPVPFIVAPSDKQSKAAISPMVVFSGDEPQAMILPVRIDETKSRVPAAVRAYFTEKPQEAADEKLAKARKERDDLELLVRQLEGQRDAVERVHGQEITRLQNIIDAKNEQIETLTARLNAQPAPVEQTPADKAAALLEQRKQKVSPFYHEKLDGLLDRCVRRLAQWTNDHNRNGASCPSVLVCGPANFPTRKKAKQNVREDSLWNDMLQGPLWGIVLRSGPLVGH